MKHQANPSPHLSWNELACKDGTPYPAAWIDRAQRLGSVFEAFRAAVGGKPLQIGSGYRTAAHNKRVGGSQRSQHVQGRAIDCYPPAGMPLDTFHAHARSFAREDRRVGGVGIYTWGVHLDLRRAARLIVWNKVTSNAPMRDV